MSVPNLSDRDETPLSIAPFGAEGREVRDFLADRDLSLKTKGLLSLLIGLADRGELSADILTGYSSDSSSATRSAIREAEQAGYLTRNRRRNPNGTLGPSYYSINGSRCAKNLSPKGWAYAIAEAARPHYVKIGCSADPKRRLAGMQTSHSGVLEILWQAPGGAALEAALHERFAQRRVRGEWFDFTGVNPVELIAEAAAG